MEPFLCPPHAGPTVTYRHYDLVYVHPVPTARYPVVEFRHVPVAHPADPDVDPVTWAGQCFDRGLQHWRARVAPAGPEWCLLAVVPQGDEHVSKTPTLPPTESWGSVWIQGEPRPDLPLLGVLTMMDRALCRHAAPVQLHVPSAARYWPRLEPDDKEPGDDEKKAEGAAPALTAWLRRRHLAAQAPDRVVDPGDVSAGRDPALLHTHRRLLFRCADCRHVAWCFDDPALVDRPYLFCGLTHCQLLGPLHPRVTRTVPLPQRRVVLPPWPSALWSRGPDGRAGVLACFLRSLSWRACAGHVAALDTPHADVPWTADLPYTLKWPVPDAARPRVWRNAPFMARAVHDPRVRQGLGMPPLVPGQPHHAVGQLPRLVPARGPGAAPPAPRAVPTLHPRDLALLLEWWARQEDTLVWTWVSAAMAQAHGFLLQVAADRRRWWARRGAPACEAWQRTFARWRTQPWTDALDAKWRQYILVRSAALAWAYLLHGTYRDQVARVVAATLYDAADHVTGPARETLGRELVQATVRHLQAWWTWGSGPEQHEETSLTFLRRYYPENADTVQALLNEAARAVQEVLKPDPQAYTWTRPDGPAHRRARLPLFLVGVAPEERAAAVRRVWQREGWRPSADTPLRLPVTVRRDLHARLRLVVAQLHLTRRAWHDSRLPQRTLVELVAAVPVVAVQHEQDWHALVRQLGTAQALQHVAWATQRQDWLQRVVQARTRALKDAEAEGDLDDDPEQEQWHDDTDQEPEPARDHDAPQRHPALDVFAHVPWIHTLAQARAVVRLGQEALEDPHRVAQLGRVWGRRVPPGVSAVAALRLLVQPDEHDVEAWTYGLARGTHVGADVQADATAHAQQQVNQARQDMETWSRQPFVRNQSSAWAHDARARQLEARWAAVHSRAHAWGRVAQYPLAQAVPPGPVLARLVEATATPTRPSLDLSLFPLEDLTEAEARLWVEVGAAAYAAHETASDVALCPDFPHTGEAHYTPPASPRPDRKAPVEDVSDISSDSEEAEARHVAWSRARRVPRTGVRPPSHRTARQQARRARGAVKATRAHTGGSGLSVRPATAHALVHERPAWGVWVHGTAAAPPRDLGPTPDDDGGGSSSDEEDVSSGSTTGDGHPPRERKGPPVAHEDPQAAAREADERHLLRHAVYPDSPGGDVHYIHLQPWRTQVDRGQIVVPHTTRGADWCAGRSVLCRDDHSTALWHDWATWLDNLLPLCALYHAQGHAHAATVLWARANRARAACVWAEGQAVRRGPHEARVTRTDLVATPAAYAYELAQAAQDTPAHAAAPVDRRPVRVQDLLDEAYYSAGLQHVVAWLRRRQASRTAQASRGVDRTLVAVEERLYWSLRHTAHGWAKDLQWQLPEADPKPAPPATSRAQSLVDLSAVTDRRPYPTPAVRVPRAVMAAWSPPYQGLDPVQRARLTQACEDALCTYEHRLRAGWARRRQLRQDAQRHHETHVELF